MYARAKSHVHPLAVVYVLRRPRAVGVQGDMSPTRVRFGFVVSKKQGGAVVRNRIKRRLREAVRAQLGALVSHDADVVFVGRKRMSTAGWDEVTAAVDELLRRSGVLSHVRPPDRAVDSQERS